ncbi:ribonuclease H-like domain-containing protein [Tanacetum coccineum]
MITRSQSDVVKPIDRLSLNTFLISPIPKNPYDALKDPQWRNAMYDEYNALVKNGTWLLVPRPTSVNMVRSMWLYKHKFHADGTLSRYKAHLVANGSSQQLGVDFDETFSPVRSLYGLKQAPRAWFQRFAGYATRARFYHSRCDSSLFIYRQGYQFDMTDLGALNYFLGISAVRHSTGLFLSQRKYAIQLLERAYMVNCNPSRTPVDTESKLGPDGVPVQGPTMYRNLAGGLQYLTFTWPDLYYAVQQICLYMNDPREPHLAALKSTSGYCVFLGDNLLSWSAKRQHTLSRSSAEAEYRGVANVVAETVCAVYMSVNPVQHQRTKHIEIDIHFVRDMVTAGQVFDKSFGFNTAVKEAQRTINAEHVEAESVENGIGVVKLMGRYSGFIAMYVTLANRDVHMCLIPESPFYLEGEGGLFEYVERSLKDNGHMVIVVAEGAGQELLAVETLKTSTAQDVSGNKLLQDGYFAKQLERILKKRTKIKSKPNTGLERAEEYESNGALRFHWTSPRFQVMHLTMYIALSLLKVRVHGVMAGYTGFTSRLVNGRQTYIPCNRICEKQNNVVITDRMWARLLSSTNQPSFLRSKEVIEF